MEYKSISFEFWSTIAGKNQQYLAAREKLIADYYDRTEAYVRRAIAEVEESDSGKDVSEYWRMLGERLGSLPPYSLYLQCYSKFFEFPPIIPYDTIRTLVDLSNTCNISIIEDTFLEPGNLIQEFLRIRGINPRKVKMLWSDYEGLPRSSARMLDMAHRSLYEDKSNCLHIGNSSVAEKVASAYGCNHEPYLTKGNINV